YKDDLLNNVQWVSDEKTYFEKLQVEDIRILENLLAVDVVSNVRMTSFYDMGDTTFSVSGLRLTLYFDKEGIVGVQDRGYYAYDSLGGLDTTELYGDVRGPKNKDNVVNKIRLTHHLYPLESGVFFSMFGAPFSIFARHFVFKNIDRAPFRAYSVWDATHLKKVNVFGNSQKEADEESIVFDLQQIKETLCGVSPIGFIVNKANSLEYVGVNEIINKASISDEHKKQLLSLLDNSLFIGQHYYPDYHVYGSKKDYFLFYDKTRHSVVVFATNFPKQEDSFFLEFAVSPDGIRLVDYAFRKGLNVFVYSQWSAKKIRFYGNAMNFSFRGSVFSNSFYEAFLPGITKEFHLPINDLSQYYWLDYFKESGKEYVLGVMDDFYEYDGRRIPVLSTVIYEVERNSRGDIVALLPLYEYNGFVILRDRNNGFHVFSLIPSASRLMTSKLDYDFEEYSKVFNSFTDLINCTYDMKTDMPTSKDQFFDNSRWFDVLTNVFINITHFEDDFNLQEKLEIVAGSMISDWTSQHYYNYECELEEPEEER
ncbi:MAG: hypothetical protein QXP36_06210, partial [Conexivisphaerales archaeon]